MPTKEYHIGIVRDRDDPLQKGRLLIEAPTIVHGESFWAEPIFPYVDSRDRAGYVFIPQVGAQVEVEIENEEDSEVTDMMYRWRCTSYPDDTFPEEFLENYPNRSGIRTAQGHKIIFDETEDLLELYVEHTTGAKIKINNDGDIILIPANGRGVFIGDEGVTQSLIRGTVLQSDFNALVSVFNSHKHTGVTTGPGTSGLTDTVGSNLSTDALSDKHKVE